MYSIYDDHEIANNFVGNSDDLKPPFPNASHAYNLYTAQANPEPKVPGSNYYDFVYGDTAFFVMDTRRYRTPAEVHLAAAANGTDEVKATMLGDTQLKALYEWAGKVCNDVALE
jgi:alkaline phosphatase D